MPEDGYGWEKLFSERMCKHFEEDFGMQVRVVRFHNVYGPDGTWRGGREKAPAALCRKIIEAKKSDNLSIEVWGDGEQTRSFMYIDDCITGLDKLMESCDRFWSTYSGDNILALSINEVFTVEDVFSLPVTMITWAFLTRN